MILEYDGTRYSGFQIQANSETIQSEVESALLKLTGEEIRIVGSGRTDSGVHALHQVVSFSTRSGIPVERYPYALNSVLPLDIRVVGSFLPEEGFHPRFSAVEKVYEYHMLTRQYPSALLRDRCWHLPHPLDTDAMRDAAERLSGTHDFGAFMASGSSVRDKVRHISISELYHQDDRLVYRVSANGFLYNMVRIIVGTLVHIGRGKAASSVIEEMLETGRRELGGKTAPPHGLYLVYVDYGEEPPRSSP